MIDNFFDILRAIFVANQQGIWCFDDDNVFNANGHDQLITVDQCVLCIQE